MEKPSVVKTQDAMDSKLSQIMEIVMDIKTQQEEGFQQLQKLTVTNESAKPEEPAGRTKQTKSTAASDVTISEVIQVVRELQYQLDDIDRRISKLESREQIKPAYSQPTPSVQKPQPMPIPIQKGGFKIPKNNGQSNVSQRLLIVIFPILTCGLIHLFMRYAYPEYI